MDKPKWEPGPWFLEGNWEADSDREIGGWLSCFPPAGVPLFEMTPVCGEREVIVASAHLIAAGPALFDALAAYVKAQGRMLEMWAEGNLDVKNRLWRDLHACEEAARTALDTARAKRED
jgi:hypothetical protein